MNEAIVTQENGGCFKCGKQATRIVFIPAVYDNGEATTIHAAVCANCYR